MVMMMMCVFFALTIKRIYHFVSRWEQEWSRKFIEIIIESLGTNEIYIKAFAHFVYSLNFEKDQFF